jgi:type IV secretory pathway VirB2 component (pilin)
LGLDCSKVGEDLEFSCARDAISNTLANIAGLIINQFSLFNFNRNMREKSMFCKNCGTQMDENQTVCTNCSNVPAESKGKVASVLEGNQVAFALSVVWIIIVGIGSIKSGFFGNSFDMAAFIFIGFVPIAGYWAYKTFFSNKS